MYYIPHNQRGGSFANHPRIRAKGERTIKSAESRARALCARCVGRYKGEE